MNPPSSTPSSTPPKGPKGGGSTPPKGPEGEGSTPAKNPLKSDGIYDQGSRSERFRGAVKDPYGTKAREADTDRSTTKKATDKAKEGAAIAKDASRAAAGDVTAMAKLSVQGATIAKKKAAKWAKRISLLLVLALVILSTGMCSAPTPSSQAWQPTPSSPFLEEFDKLPAEIEDLYTTAAKAHNIPWTVLAAIGKVATDHGRRDPFDPTHSSGDSLGRPGGPQGIFMMVPHSGAPSRLSDNVAVADYLAASIADMRDEVLEEGLPEGPDVDTPEGVDLLYASIIPRLPIAVQGGTGLAGQGAPGSVDRMIIIGDSLTVGTKGAGLASEVVAAEFPAPIIEALEGRAISEGIQILKSVSPRPGDFVILALGTNNDPNPETIGNLVETAMIEANGATVMWVNVDLATWTETNNVFVEKATAWQNMFLADWSAEATLNPSWRASDNVHYNSAGYEARTEFYVSEALRITGITAAAETAPVVNTITPSAPNDGLLGILPVPVGCPTSLPPGGLKGGNGDVGQICARSVAAARTPEAAAAIKFAMTAVGVPYNNTYKRNNLGYFDCSSLVTRAYQAAGVPIAPAGQNAPTTHAMLPRNNWQRAAWSVPVTSTQAKPGDLVFPHEGHVTMLLADGWIVHAPAPGQFVHLRPMYAQPLAFRRVDVAAAKANPWGGPQFANSTGIDDTVPVGDAARFAQGQGSNNEIVLFARFYGGLTPDDNRSAPDMKSQFRPAGVWTGDENDVVGIIRSIFPPGDAENAIRIADAESSLNPSALNVNTNGSTDWGLFQLNDGDDRTRSRWGCTDVSARCGGTLQTLYHDGLTSTDPDDFLNSTNTPLVQTLEEMQQLAFDPVWATRAAAQLWLDGGAGMSGWRPWCSASVVLGIDDVC